MEAGVGRTVKELEATLNMTISSLSPAGEGKGTGSIGVDISTGMGIGLAIGETYYSMVSHVPLAVLFLATMVPFTLDAVLLNGVLSETIVRTLNPAYRRRVAVHEAGHFLVSYLLGCPIEGVVMSGAQALMDERFRGLAAGVSAGVR